MLHTSCETGMARPGGRLNFRLSAEERDGRNYR